MNLDRDINAAINILFEGINTELAKIESDSFANSPGDLNNYKNYRISKVVDGIVLNSNLFEIQDLKETSPFMVR